MVIVEGDQSTPEWNALRIGNPGASSFKKIVTTKGEPSKSRKEYLYELAGEIIIGKKQEGYSNHHMEEGLIMEQKSRSLYEFLYDVDITQVALCYKDEQKKYHCSPDGLILSEKRGYETKNTLPKIQIARLLNGKLPTEHFTQCQGSMLVTGYDEWIFQSYSAGLPPLTLIVERDDEFLNKLEAELDSFCFDLAILTKKLKEM